MTRKKTQVERGKQEEEKSAGKRRTRNNETRVAHVKRRTHRRHSGKKERRGIEWATAKRAALGIPIKK
jgi:hypothetical protein